MDVRVTGSSSQEEAMERPTAAPTLLERLTIIEQELQLARLAALEERVKQLETVVGTVRSRAAPSKDCEEANNGTPLKENKRRRGVLAFTDVSSPPQQPVASKRRKPDRQASIRALTAQQEKMPARPRQRQRQQPPELFGALDPWPLIQKALREPRFRGQTLPTMQAFALPKVVFHEDLDDEFKQPPTHFDPHAHVPINFWEFWSTDRSHWHETDYYCKQIYQPVAQTALCGDDTPRNLFCFALLRLIMSGQAGVYDMTDMTDRVLEKLWLTDNIASPPHCQVCRKANHTSTACVALFEPGNADAVDYIACGRYCAAKLSALQRLFHLLNNIDQFQLDPRSSSREQKADDCEFEEDDGDAETHCARLCMAHVEAAVRQCIEANAAARRVSGDNVADQQDAVEEVEDVDTEPASRPSSPHQGRGLLAGRPGLRGSRTPASSTTTQMQAVL